MVPLVAAVTAAFPTANEAAAARPCPPTGAQTTASSAHVHVYWKSVDELVACVRRTGRRFNLHGREFYWPEPLGPVATRGRFVAYFARFCGSGEEGCNYEVVLFDVKRGRRTRTFHNPADPTGCRGPDYDCGLDGVGSIVVTARGSLAWISCSQYPRSCPAVRRTRVVRFDSRGLKVLDAGRAVRSRSLELSSSRRSLTWLHGRERRRASIR